MEQGKRNSTREKKLPKYFQADSEEYGIFAGAKIGECRPIPVKKEEPKTAAQELNQIAKLLVKFVGVITQSMHFEILGYRDSDHERSTEKQKKKNMFNSDSDVKRDNQSKRQDYQTSEAVNSSKRLKDGPKEQLPATDPLKPSQKALPSSGKAKQLPARQQGSMGMSTDLQYHTLLNEHIRQSFPDIKNLSPEMLMQLGIPVRLETQAASLKMKAAQKEKEKQRKKNVVHQISQKQIKDDLKPFKRQSYHAAIAYHIYLRNLKANATETGGKIDPTYYSKKFREESIKALQKKEKEKINPEGAQEKSNQQSRLTQKKNNGNAGKQTLDQSK